MTALSALLNGMSAMGFVIAALFFCRFWRRTNDQLFLAFCAAFVLFALNQILIVLTFVPEEGKSLLYLPRILAFAVLIGAIIVKNLGKRPSAGP